MGRKVEKRAISPDTAASDPPTTRKRSRKSMGKEDKDTGDKKKALVWNKKDEITILQAHPHCIKNGVFSPGECVSQIMQSVKDSIEHDVSNTQMYEKLRSLQRRYESTLKKIQDPHFQFKDSEEEQIFQISKCIWAEFNADEQQGCHFGNPGIQNTEISFAVAIEETMIVLSVFYNGVKNMLKSIHDYTKTLMEDSFNTKYARNSDVTTGVENQMNIDLSRLVTEVGPLMAEFYQNVAINLKNCYTSTMAVVESQNRKLSKGTRRRHSRRLQILHENVQKQQSTLRQQSLGGEANDQPLE